MTERRADEATRDAENTLKCEFMQDKIGRRFAGNITGVTSFGLFVELDQVYVEGLVHISSLADDYYQFDSTRMLLKGERTAVRYRLGDSVDIIVTRVDIDERKIDFVLAHNKNTHNRKRDKKPRRSRR